MVCDSFSRSLDRTHVRALPLALCLAHALSVRIQTGAVESPKHESNLGAESAAIGVSAGSSLEIRECGSGGFSAVNDAREAAGDVDVAADQVREAASSGATADAEGRESEKVHRTLSVQRMLFPPSVVGTAAAVVPDVQDGGSDRAGDENVAGPAGGAEGRAPDISLSSAREDEDAASMAGGEERGGGPGGGRGGGEGGGGEEGMGGEGECVRETAIETQDSTPRLEDVRDRAPSSPTPVMPEDSENLHRQGADVTPPSALSLKAGRKRGGSLACRAANMVDHLLDDDDVSEEEGGNADDAEF